MKALFQSITFCIVFCFLLHHTLLAQSDQALKQRIQNELARQQLTGAVWVLVEPDGNLTSGSAGIKNTDTRSALKATDKVYVGSVTKMVLAAGVLHLATTGKIKLDDPVVKYLPDVKFKNNWEATDPVTIRHLLDHTSGLSDLRLWHMFSTTSSPDAPLSDFNARDPDLLVLQNRPGAVFSYSNMGYTLLGMVLETVTGQRYEHYLDEQLLKPLGMLNSTFRFLTQTGAAADTALAMGHLDKGQPFAALPVYVRPAAQFTTTAHDMGLFLRFMMGDGYIKGKSFIAKAYLDGLGMPHYTNAAKAGLPYGYALGASYRDRHGVLGITHSGNIVGYRAMCYMFPKQQKAFFIAHNTDSETADYEVFNEILVRHLNVSTPPQKLAAAATTGLQEWDGFYVPASVKVVPFGLLDIITGYTRVRVHENGATFAPFQKSAVQLHYLGNRRFMAEGKVAPSHAFYKTTDGNFFVTNGLITVRKTSGMRIGWIAASFIAGLAGMLFLLVSGIYQGIRFWRQKWELPLLPYLLSLVVILLAVAFMLTQPFVALGDKNAGTLLLAVATGLLPAGIVLAIFRSRKNGFKRLLSKLDLISLVLVLQFLLLLLVHGLLPLMLWR